MKRICSLCGAVVPDMDFYVHAREGIVCSCCIVERGVQVAGAHAGPEPRGDAVFGPERFGRVANLEG